MEIPLNNEYPKIQINKTNNNNLYLKMYFRKKRYSFKFDNLIIFTSLKKIKLKHNTTKAQRHKVHKEHI
jgi:hypothetical protein